MTTAKIKSKVNFPTYFELNLEICLPIPTALEALENKQEIADSYKQLYGIDRVQDNKVYFNKTMSFPLETTVEIIEQTLTTVLANYEAALSVFAITPLDELTGKTRTGNIWIYIPEVITTNQQAP